jgi:hypothetical protein
MQTFMELKKTKLHYKGAGRSLIRKVKNKNFQKFFQNKINLIINIKKLAEYYNRRTNLNF